MAGKAKGPGTSLLHFERGDVFEALWRRLFEIHDTIIGNYLGLYSTGGGPDHLKEDYAAVFGRPWVLQQL